MAIFAQVVELNSQSFVQHVERRKLNCSCDNKIGGNAPTKALQDFIQQKGKEKVSFPSTSTINPPPDRALLNQRSKY